MRIFLLLLAGLFVSLSLAACQSKPVPADKPLPPLPVSDKVEQTGPYRIGVGDEIELKFFYTPELNDRMTVRPDGKISVMFEQDMQAAGRTAEELADLVKRKLSTHLKQLDLVIIVRTFASQKVYVSGEVAKPGPVMLTGRENLIQVINDAGWVTPLADKDRVMLVRKGDNGKDIVYTIDLHKILNGEDMRQNVALKAGDMVLVPPSGITSTDRWIDQYVRQIIPVNAGVFVSSNR